MFRHSLAREAASAIGGRVDRRAFVSRFAPVRIEDVIGRNFRQPAEGLGFDGSPVAHMWRTMIWPNNFL